MEAQGSLQERARQVASMPGLTWQQRIASLTGPGVNARTAAQLLDPYYTSAKEERTPRAHATYALPSVSLPPASPPSPVAPTAAPSWRGLISQESAATGLSAARSAEALAPGYVSQREAKSANEEFAQSLIEKNYAGTLEPMYVTFLRQTAEAPVDMAQKVQNVALQLHIRANDAAQLLEPYITSTREEPKTDLTRGYFTAPEVYKLARALGLAPVSDKLANVLMVRQYLNRLAATGATPPASPRFM